MANDEPVYVSGRCFKSLGNEYRIYPDRLELNVPFLLTTFVVPRRELRSIAVFPPLVIRTALVALKLDLADLHEHVGVVRERGLFKQLRFTPRDPRAFEAKVRETFGR